MEPKLVKKDGKYFIQNNGRLIDTTISIQPEMSEEERECVESWVNDLEKYRYAVIESKDGYFNITFECEAYTNLEDNSITFDCLDIDAYNIELDKQFLKKTPALTKKILVMIQHELSGSYNYDIHEIGYSLAEYKTKVKEIKEFIKSLNKQYKTWTEEQKELFQELYER